MDKKTISSQAVRQVLRDYLTQYKALPFQATLALLLPSIGTIFIFFLPPLVISKMVNIFVIDHTFTFSSVGIYIALFGGSWLFGEILWRFGMHAIIKLESHGINTLGKLAFKRLADRDYNFYTNNFVGSLTKRAYSFTRGFEMFSETMSMNVVNNIVPLIFAVIILWRYSFWIPLVLIIVLFVVILAALPLIRRRSRLVTKRNNASSWMSGGLSDAMTNILAIKSFAKEEQEALRHGENVDRYTEAYTATYNYSNMKLDALLSPFYVGTNVIGLMLAVYFTQKFNLQAGVIIIIFSYYSSISRMFWDINRIYRNIEAAVTDAAEFTQMFVEPAEVVDANNASRLRVSEAAIHFDKVGFKYPGGEEDGDSFLNDFSLDIKANQKVGLVGPSGGGKTTITKLLLRYIDLQSGAITIDGQDISKVTQTSLREAIAYVPQEPLLFHRTLYENIAYGDENATKEDVMRAAQIAHADEFIDQLPHGYDTLVGERGIKLSGGQRQRVAIARALLKKSSILVLDEATSSLDSESEKYIQDGLKELMKNKTTLVIAHRLSTIKNLDRIIVLEQGKIVQDGTHDELIKKKGLYAKLWSHQSGEFM